MEETSDQLSNVLAQAESDAKELLSRNQFPEAVRVYDDCLQKISRMIQDSHRGTSGKNCCQSMKNEHVLAKAYNNRGHVHYLDVEFDLALRDYDASLKLDPNLPCVYYNRGTVLYRLGDFDEALESAKRALELDPENEDFKEAFEYIVKAAQKHS